MSAIYEDVRLRRLAVAIPYQQRLPDPMGTSEKRSPICGSRVTVDVDLGPDGRVAAIGLLVRACLLGQASSALMAAEAVGRTPAELVAARDALARWLASGEGDAPDWPGLDLFVPALGASARHASIRLAFDAVADAAAQAAERREAAIGAAG